MSDPRSLGSGYIRNVPFLPLVHYCVVIYRGVHSCDSLGAYTGGWPRGPGVLVEVGRWRSSRMRWSGMCTLVVEWMVHHSLVMEMGWVTNLLDVRSLTMEMSRYRDPRSVLCVLCWLAGSLHTGIWLQWWPLCLCPYAVQEHEEAMGYRRAYGLQMDGWSVGRYPHT